MTAALQTLLEEGKIRSFEFEDDSVVLYVNCKYNKWEECYDNATEKLSHEVRHVLGQHGLIFQYDALECVEEHATVERWVYA